MKSATSEAASQRASQALNHSLTAMLGWGQPQAHLEEHGADGFTLHVQRQRLKSGSWRPERRPVRVGPNRVHVGVIRGDGRYEDHGVSTNLLTNIGRDVWAQTWGFIGAGATSASPATATSATSVTVTGTPLTASNLTTPQLGLAGLRVYMPVTGITTAPVYGNIVSNTTSVITVDQWWTVSDGTGTTPASTNALIVAPGGVAAFRFAALSTNVSAPVATDTTLASEVTTNGGGRALATYAHTYGASTLTLTHTWTASGTISGISKAGLFAALTSAGADPMIYETALSVSVNLAALDTLQITWTFTLSG